MGSRGPERLPDGVLERRGSALAKSRKKEKRDATEQAEQAKQPHVWIENDSRQVLRKICKTGIPGYDPWDQGAGYRWDYDLACKAIGFFQNRLTHVKGAKARKPFILERWQKAIIGNLFGWVSKSDGTRRYREAFLLIPRKNGKTPMAAGILLYMLFEDGEPGAEIYGAASTYKQASLVFAHARGMVLQDRGDPSRNGDGEPLADRCKIFKGQAKAIELHSDFSIYHVIAADAEPSHGFNTHGAVVDELHAQPNRDLVDTLETSIIGRENPLIVHITTADFDRESICNEKQDIAQLVIDNAGDENKPGFVPTLLPVIYAATTDDDWTDEKVWRRVNPNLDVCVSLKALRVLGEKAKDVPSFENTFKRLHLNIRTKSDKKFFDMDQWDGPCAAPVDAEALKGRKCYGGLDLSSRSDVSALVLVFPDEDGGYDVLPFFWIPGENAHRRERKDRVPYITWSNQGYVELTDHNRIDQCLIRKKINGLGELYDIQSICIDRWDASKITSELQDDGFEMIEFGQGMASMTSPTKEVEAMVMGGNLRHGGNPCLRWMANNTAVEEDAAGNLKPSKKKSHEKIDGIVALIMALARGMVMPSGVSVYKDRGLLSV